MGCHLLSEGKIAPSLSFFPSFQTNSPFLLHIHTHYHTFPFHCLITFTLAINFSPLFPFSYPVWAWSSGKKAVCSTPGAKEDWGGAAPGRGEKERGRETAGAGETGEREEGEGGRWDEKEGRFRKEVERDDSVCVCACVCEIGRTYMHREGEGMWMSGRTQDTFAVKIDFT